ncbi:MAG: Na+/H+ antiporter [Acidobacteriota bacterium]|nr:Na+/H+ antiporter [Acidobacteriota bacterium]
MSASGLHGVQLVLLLLLLFVVVFSTLAKRLQTPYPIVLVIAGLLVAFIPGIPKVSLDPDMVFLVVLPPLLYSAAWVTSWRDFSYNLTSIASLAIGLVAFTVFGVAAAVSWVFSGMDWHTGVVLGAVVATTDAIAATSIAKRIGLPKRIVDILEGESLLNDATGLLALEFATAMVVYGQNPTVFSAAGRLAYLIAAGIAIGLVIARIVEWFEHRIDDGPIEIAVSLFVPYATYLAAEALHASGVLAVVAAGLYLSRRSSRFFSPSVRLQAYSVWGSLTFILNGLVFVLIGLQLPYVLAGIREVPLTKLLLYGLLFSALLIVLRLVWSFPGAYVAYYFRKHVLHQREDPPSLRNVFVIGWTGMRGVIALAAAISLPQTIADGSPFPHRDLIVFLTFAVILVTLVVQGLTLPPLIRSLGLAAPTGPDCEEQEARRLMIEAAIAYLNNRDRANEPPESTDLYDDIHKHYTHRLANISHQDGQPHDTARELYDRYLALSQELLDTERNTAVRLRDEGRINDEVLRQLEHELDLSETRLAATTPDSA